MQENNVLVKRLSENEQDICRGPIDGLELACRRFAGPEAIADHL